MGYNEPLSTEGFFGGLMAFVGSLGLLLELHHYHLDKREEKRSVREEKPEEPGK
jgi:hypothetical protein